MSNGRNLILMSVFIHFSKEKEQKTAMRLIEPRISPLISTLLAFWQLKPQRHEKEAANVASF